MIQWLRIHLQMWGTQLRSLVWEHPTCLGAAKSICANFRISGRAPLTPEKIWVRPQKRGSFVQLNLVTATVPCEIFFKKFIRFWLCWVSTAACFSLAAESGGYALVVACRFFVVVASLVAEDRL